MVPKNTGQLKYRVTYVYLCAVIHVAWIAAFLIKTKFKYFFNGPPGKNSYSYFCALVIRTGALFCTLFSLLRVSKSCRCRSPPSDFDFASQFRNRNWRKLL